MCWQVELNSGSQVCRPEPSTRLKTLASGTLLASTCRLRNAAANKNGKLTAGMTFSAGSEDTDWTLKAELPYTLPLPKKHRKRNLAKQSNLKIGLF